MNHYIVTRMNAPVFPTRTDLHHLQLDDEWLRQRLGIFAKYTYPSICAQTAQDFEWIVWCHQDSPDWFVEEMKKFTRACVIFDTQWEGHADRDTDILITTRIDNDDIIHNRFIELTQHQVAEFRRSRLLRMVYSFTKGYRYIVGRNNMRKADQTNSPFLSLFVLPERVGEENWDVYCTDHGLLPGMFETWYNTEDRVWAWLQHETNTAGITATKGGAVPSTTLKDFGVEI